MRAQEWWTHLWLNEGFASWIEYLCVDHCFPEYDIWTQFVSADYTRALDLDALDSSHPIEVSASAAAVRSHFRTAPDCCDVVTRPAGERRPSIGGGRDLRRHFLQQGGVCDSHVAQLHRGRGRRPRAHTRVHVFFCFISFPP